MPEAVAAVSESISFPPVWKRNEPQYCKENTVKKININEWNPGCVDIWASRWLLLTAGNSKDYNSMTVAWGSIGNMWNLPFAQVVVRPTRHTFGFMEKYSTFTLCTFPEKYRDALLLLGKKSGRDGDKISESGLTPVPSGDVEAPAFQEADQVLECRKMYWQDMNPRHFLDPSIEDQYPEKDYHRVYFGRIVALYQAD